MSDLLQSLASEMIPAVEAEMRAALAADGRQPDLFDGMLQYHMGWVDETLQPVTLNGGKRIRPLLCLLSCQAAGGDWRTAVPAAAAVELLHNFTLIHDDIQDNSPTRRGRETLWRLWGVPQAINSGDAMFAIAHLTLYRLAERVAPGERGVPAERVVQAARRFDETCVLLTRGQFNDMRFETETAVSVDEYLDMIRGKTAVLLSLCAELGALIAGADAAQVEHYAAFGLELGLAFQVRDDILGIWGEESVIGKSAATDIETRKKSLPVLYGLAQSDALTALYRADPAPADFVTQAIDLLDEAGAHAYAVSHENAYSESALDHLAAVRPSDPGGAALRELALKLLNRQA
jgi:geranylgeranyl diphosphate synthase, type I